MFKVGTVWEGRGLKVRIVRIGSQRRDAVILVDRLDLTWFRIHPWLLASMDGMKRVKS